MHESRLILPTHLIEQYLIYAECRPGITSITAHSFMRTCTLPPTLPFYAMEKISNFVKGSETGSRKPFDELKTTHRDPLPSIRPLLGIRHESNLTEKRKLVFHI
jgi:hypothetical protein